VLYLGLGGATTTGATSSFLTGAGFDFNSFCFFL